jgi:hydrogenase maturation protease
MNIAVLGLGNLMLTDDGIGIHAIRILSVDSRLPRSVQIIEGGTLGLDLLHSLRGVTHLLAVDAVDTGAAPGTLSRFVDGGLADLPIGKSVHLLGFADLLGSLRLLEDAPLEVVLLGIQPESTDWGVSLSPIVDAALHDLVDAALDQLSYWQEANRSEQDSCTFRSRPESDSDN